MSCPGEAGEALEPEGLPLLGLSPLLSACFLGWWDRLPVSSDVATSPYINHTAGPESLGGTYRPLRDVASHLPTWRATAGDQEPWRFVPAAREGDTHGHLPCSSSWGFGHSLRPPAPMTQIGHLLRALGR